MMKQNIVLSLFFIVLCSNANAQNFPTGLLFDRKAYEATPSVPPTKDFERTLEAFSLQQYCPTPGNQQAQGSCVGWATTYGARTIMAAVRGNMTNAEDIAAEALSPSYVFNQINEEAPTTIESTTTDQLVSTTTIQ